MQTMRALTRVTAMSETTIKNTALRLQGVLIMKSTIVGLLAVVALGGCGVGLDDPEGQQAVAGSTSAALITKPAPDQPELLKPRATDPHALPQDPIPLFEGKLGPGGNPPPDPMSDTRPLK